MRSYWSFALLYAAWAWIAWAVISPLSIFIRSLPSATWSPSWTLRATTLPITLPESTDEFFELSAPAAVTTDSMMRGSTMTTGTAMDSPAAGAPAVPPCFPRIR
jgi:hypothetical protein